MRASAKMNSLGFSVVASVRVCLFIQLIIYQMLNDARCLVLVVY